jgi:hypothetical protein
MNHLEIGRLHNSDVKILSNDFSQKTHLFSDKKIAVDFAWLQYLPPSKRKQLGSQFAARWDCSRIFEIVHRARQ